jgi:hypothetical protein
MWRNGMIKLFIWKHFIERFYGEWIDEFAHDYHVNNMCDECEHEDMRCDLD